MDNEEATQVTTQAANDLQEDTALCVLVDTSKENQVKRHYIEPKDSDTWTFGRSGGPADFVVSHSKRISKGHFVIFRTKDDPTTLLIKDTSTNGTFMNGTRITRNRGYILVQGDDISIGNGVAKDEIHFLVMLPGQSRHIPTEGVHAVYDIGKVLGKGAFATVRKATERESGKTYAVKVIGKNKLHTNWSAITREINILKQLNHRYIVGLKDVYEDDQNFFLVMDYVGGGDLMEFVIENGVIPEDAAQEIIRQILLAVKYVHRMGISHRDLKPDNILIAQDNPVQIKVSDFGLAKVHMSGTFLKTFCGTLAYLAPEVLGHRSGRHTAAAPSAATASSYSNLVDMWSIGCLAYVILTGFLPFDGSTQDELYKRVMKGNFHQSPLDKAGVSESAISFLKAVLQVDPAKRPTAEQALAHPWVLAAGGDSQSSEPNTMLADMHLDAIDEVEEENESKIGNLQNGDKVDKDVKMACPALSNAASVSHDSDSDGVEFSQMIQREQWDLVRQGGPQSSHIPFPLSIRDLEEEAPVEEYTPGTWIKLATTPESIPAQDIFIAEDRAVIGRAHTNELNDVNIDDLRISKVHCCLSRLQVDRDGQFQAWLTDLSTNGCYVNKIKIGKGKKVQLSEGDQVCLFMDVALTSKDIKMMAFDVLILDQTHFVGRKGSAPPEVLDDADAEPILTQSVLAAAEPRPKRPFNTLSNDARARPATGRPTKRLSVRN